MNKIQIITSGCQNPDCKRAIRAGRHVHVIPDDSPDARLVLPEYHFATAEEGIAAVQRAWESAEMITTDAQLFSARERDVSYKIMKGWVDPSVRDHAHDTGEPCALCD